MKTFKFNRNDYVTVTLTKEGAEYINQKLRSLYDLSPILPKRKHDYEDGDIYRANFWDLVNDFGFSS